MPLTWKPEEHGYPFRNWTTAELSLASATPAKGETAKLRLMVFELKTIDREPLPYYWAAEASFEDENHNGGLESVNLWIQQPARPGEPGHLADETAAKAACVAGAKQALLALIAELG